MEIITSLEQETSCLEFPITLWKLHSCGLIGSCAFKKLIVNGSVAKSWVFKTFIVNLSIEGQKGERDVPAT